MKLRSPFIALTTVVLLVFTVMAQNLTVQEIMAEPSIAGMRVTGEKLSPDGTKVIYLWNAENKLPLDLYMTSTDGRGTPQIILRVSDVPAPSPSPTSENKLGYGLTVRDEFVKERENAFGNFEWSPDSKRLLFSQGGDLYVLTLGSSDEKQVISQWRRLEESLKRRADLLPNLVNNMKGQGIQEQEIFVRFADARSRLLNALLEMPKAANGDKSESQKGNIISVNLALSNELERLISLTETYPALKSNDSFQMLLDELRGTENRIHVSLDDYDDAKAKLKRHTKTQAPEVGARFIDNYRVLYQQNGNLFVLNTADATTVQLSRDANAATFIGVGNATVSKDGKMLAYVVSDNSKQRALFVPNYLGEFVEAPTTRRGWSEQKIMIVPTDGSRDTATEIKLPKSEGVSNFRRMAWAADGRSLIVDRNDKDTKRRQLFYVFHAGSKDEQQIMISDETDDKWQAPLSAIFEPNPKDPSQLFFCSEKDGYNHIYLATLERRATEPNPTGQVRQENLTDAGYTGKVDIKQLTKGNWQVEWAKWNGTSEREIILGSTQRNSAERELYMLHISGTEADIEELHADHIAVEPDYKSAKTRRGIKSDFQISQDVSDPVVLYTFSQWNRPSDLYGWKVCTRPCRVGSVPTQLTNTTPKEFVSRTWNEPKLLDIPSRDGKQIKSKIYLPAGFDQKKKYPDGDIRPRCRISAEHDQRLEQLLSRVYV